MTATKDQEGVDEREGRSQGSGRYGNVLKEHTQLLCIDAPLTEFTVFKFQTVQLLFTCSPPHHLTILQAGAQCFSPEQLLLLVYREINALHPILSILETFRFEDFFQRCVVSIPVAIDVV